MNTIVNYMMAKCSFLSLLKSQLKHYINYVNNVDMIKSIIYYRNMFQQQYISIYIYWWYIIYHYFGLLNNCSQDVTDIYKVGFISELQ